MASCGQISKCCGYDWWSLQSPGAAIAVVQYTSALIYRDDENSSSFAPWTPDKGGGPPVLVGVQWSAHAHRWLDVNLRFLRPKRSRSRPVQDVLRRAVAVLAVLANQPARRVQHEHAVAARVEAGLLSRTDTLQSRCAELPVFLDTVYESSGLSQWSR